MVKYDDKYGEKNIIIGQYAEENDEIIKNAKQSDLWFHLAKLPSCHVILSSNCKPLDNNMIKYCAQLTKENSKYKNINLVTVNYTEIKNVKRTEKKGQVILKGKINSLVI